MMGRGRERGRWWAAGRGMEAQEVSSWYLVDEREEHLVSCAYLVVPPQEEVPGEHLACLCHLLLWCRRAWKMGPFVMVKQSPAGSSSLVHWHKSRPEENPKEPLP